MIGIMTALLIFLYVSYERSYDDFVPAQDRIYKLILKRNYPDHATWFSSGPPAFGEVIASDFPEVERMTVMGGRYNNVVINYQNGTHSVSFKEDCVMAADSSFFSFFYLPLIRGKPESV